MVITSFSGRIAWYCAIIAVLAAMPLVIYFVGGWTVYPAKSMVRGVLPLYAMALVLSGMSFMSVVAGCLAYLRYRDWGGVYAMVLAGAAFGLCWLVMRIYYN